MQRAVRYTIELMLIPKSINSCRTNAPAQRTPSIRIRCRTQTHPAPTRIRLIANYPSINCFFCSSAWRTQGCCGMNGENSIKILVTCLASRLSIESYIKIPVSRRYHIRYTTVVTPANLKSSSHNSILRGDFHKCHEQSVSEFIILKWATLWQTSIKVWAKQIERTVNA